MNVRINAHRTIPATLVMMLAASLAGPVYSAAPAACSDRDTYRHFPRVAVDSPHCVEDTGRMVALAGTAVKSLNTGFVSIQISVPGDISEVDPVQWELGIFDGDTGQADGSGIKHWDAGSTELSYSLFVDPNRVRTVAPTDLIDDWVGNATGQPTAGTDWTASPDHLPDNAWWTFVADPIPAALGSDGNYHFHLVVLYNPDGLNDVPQTISDFRLRGRASADGFANTVQVGFSTNEFAFEGAQHNLADVATIYPGWDGTFPPSGSTFWLDEVAAGNTTYDGTWSFIANLPALASLELYDGDFDYGNDATAGIPGFPSTQPLAPCPASDTDDSDSFVFPNTEDPGVVNAFPFFVILASPSHPEHPVGTDDSLPQGAIAAGGSPTDNTFIEPNLRQPCVTYRLIDPTGRIFDNLNPSSQREWEQFRICSASADFPGQCDYTVADTLLPAGVWRAEIEGMDLSNLNTWFFDAEPETDGCLLDVEKTATPGTVIVDACDTLGRPDEVVFRYTGADCDPSGNDQGADAGCVGDPAGAEPVEMVITVKPDWVVVTPPGETIYVGDLVTFSRAPGRNRLHPNLEIEILQNGQVIQALNVHTSCSVPLATGDRFGALTVVTFIGDNGTGGNSNEVTYTYEVTNNADPLTDVDLEDDLLGPIASDFTLASGETKTFTTTAFIQETTTNVGTATGETSLGTMCSDQDSATVTVASSAPSTGSTKRK